MYSCVHFWLAVCFSNLHLLRTLILFTLVANLLAKIPWQIFLLKLKILLRIPQVQADENCFIVDVHPNIRREWQSALVVLPYIGRSWGYRFIGINHSTLFCPGIEEKKDHANLCIWFVLSYLWEERHTTRVLFLAPFLLIPTPLQA